MITTLKGNLIIMTFPEYIMQHQFYKQTFHENYHLAVATQKNKLSSQFTDIQAIIKSTGHWPYHDCLAGQT